MERLKRVLGRGQERLEQLEQARHHAQDLARRQADADARLRAVEAQARVVARR